MFRVLPLFSARATQNARFGGGPNFTLGARELSFAESIFQHEEASMFGRKTTFNPLVSFDKDPGLCGDIGMGLHFINPDPTSIPDRALNSSAMRHSC